MDGQRPTSNTTVIRPAWSAGQWYPEDAGQLAETIDRMLAAAPAPARHDPPRALIAPHAGYAYSGAVAASAYRQLQGHHYDRVILLGFSHRAATTYRGIEVTADLQGYQTPLGVVPVDEAACDTLLAQRVYLTRPGTDTQEHSLELQLPFLQRTIGDCPLVPLHVGKLVADDHALAARALQALFGEATLLVVSTDFTHHGAAFGFAPFGDDLEQNLTTLASDAAAPILRCDYDGFVDYLARTGDTICGRGPVAVALKLLAGLGGADVVRTGFDISGRQTGDWSRTVTYQAFAFHQPQGRLDVTARHELLRLARAAAGSYLSGSPPMAIDAATLPAALQTEGASFVTLKNHGLLRGCIGNMVAVGPLYQSVMRNAEQACQDFRFASNPVTAAELDDIDVEISCLTPMLRADDATDVVVGRHGVQIELHGRRGVLLPQVASERGWSRVEFLEQLCRKAGLPRDAWRLDAAELHTFEAEVFGEKEGNRH